MDKKTTLEYLQSVIRDTSPEMLLLQQDVWQKFSDEKKLLLTMELMDTSIQLLEASIKNHHPEWETKEIQMEMLESLYRNTFTREEFMLVLKSVKNYKQKVS